MIAVLDYGASNLFSVKNALTAIGASFRLVGSPAELNIFEKILLPGVGHFGQMMAALERLELRQPLISAANAGTPVLGICLGMQALFDGSDEAPGVNGLGLLPGKIRSLPKTCRVPHMGWNNVLFSEGDEDWFYFANSYALPRTEATWGVTDYSGEFTSAVRTDNIWGFQFHPEKSGAAGLNLLSRWCNFAG